MIETLDLTDVQGLVVRGHGTLPHAAFLLFSVDNPAATRALMGRWADEVTDASARADDTAMQVALTASGMRAMGLPEEVVEGFSPQFSEGMSTEHRSRLLGDIGDADPRLWSWGDAGNTPAQVLVMVYARTPGILEEKLSAVQKATEGAMRQVVRLDTDELIGREPFGFNDGLSQPKLAGLAASESTETRTVPAGEFVLGYRNAYDQYTERPLLTPDADPGRILPRDPAGSDAADFGRNGTYLVFRHLRQDVDGFWSYLREQTRRLDGTEDASAQRRLASKMVGRWPSGTPLVLSPDADNPRVVGQDFGYHEHDPRGFACPIGAHIRRANPRDSLPPRPGCEASFAVNDRHRLLRRGRSYTVRRNGAAAERGLHFICLNANLARQFEFVQHSWLNDPTFNGLHDDADPIVAPWDPDTRTRSSVRQGTTFTEQADPVRRRHRGVPAFVRIRGGGYFFLPGRSALRYIGQLGDIGQVGRK